MLSFGHGDLPSDELSTQSSGLTALLTNLEAL